MQEYRIPGAQVLRGRSRCTSVVDFHAAVRPHSRRRPPLWYDLESMWVIQDIKPAHFAFATTALNLLFTLQETRPTPPTAVASGSEEKQAQKE